VSDEDKQSPERSFAMQRQHIQEQLLTPSDVPFSREYTDLLSGTNPNRKDYQQMLSDAATGKFSHLGLYRADRFGRNTVEGLQAATQLMSLGIKIRIANMPGLQPENPDGFFLFLLQMGLAQREVDVLAQRTRGGMEAKLRAGGWPQRAPHGYLNKERQVSSNKYDRWVELDLDYAPVFKQAWELLLTGSYTLKQICDELARRGYSRASGRRWAWDDPKTGARKYAANQLHKVFHNPFYAGWVVSERFGIKMGEVRGQWEPVISTEEFNKGLAILHKNDHEKSRNKKHFYLLRNLLWVDINGKQYKMYVSTPSGKTKSYSYYITHTKPKGSQVRISCEVIDEQIPEWLRGFAVDPQLMPQIQKIYQKQVKAVVHDGRDNQIVELKRRLSKFQDEEARLVRLYITGNMSEETYKQMRAEWEVKLREVEINLANIEKEASISFDDLDVALALMVKLADLFERLKKEQKANLLQILIKRIIVDADGEIINIELNSPFMYLRNLVYGIYSQKQSSDQISVGVQIIRCPNASDFCINKRDRCGERCSLSECFALIRVSILRKLHAYAQG